MLMAITNTLTGAAFLAVIALIVTVLITAVFGVLDWTWVRNICIVAAVIGAVWGLLGTPSEYEAAKIRRHGP